MPYFAGHGLIAPTLYKKFAADCTDEQNPSDECLNDIGAAHDQVGPVNIYNIYVSIITEIPL